MKTLLRGLLSLAIAVATFYFISLVGGAIVYGFGLPFWLFVIPAVPLAVLTARYVWRRTGSVQPSLFRSVAVGAVVTGGLGFCAGFFGPLLFTPGANQGPLLGIFITGPLGLVVGGVAGGIYWLVRARTPGASGRGG